MKVIFDWWMNKGSGYFVIFIVLAVLFMLGKQLGIIVPLNQVNRGDCPAYGPEKC